MSIVVAFLAGILTFFSPCVIPLIPSYISFITGHSVEELARGENKAVMKKALWGSLSYIGGFSLVFILLGITASFAGSLVYEFQNYLRIIGGVIIIMLGMMMTGILKLDFLEVEKRIAIKKKASGNAGAFMLGMTFAAAWVPCVGPILSSILIIASISGSRFYGGLLLLSYCLGLGIPILISALAFNYFLSMYKRLRKYQAAVSIVSGAILIALGFIVLADKLTLLSNYFVLLLGRHLK